MAKKENIEEIESNLKMFHAAYVARKSLQKIDEEEAAEAAKKAEEAKAAKEAGK